MSNFSGHWMQTFTGRKFYPLNPHPDHVHIDDIAHALGMLCRFGGHVSQFYSVAEHSYLLSHLVAPENALHALLHDSTEAYVQDIVRPLKHQLPQYQEAEEKVWGVIAQHFGISINIPDEVRDADARILITERDTFFPNNINRWSVDDLEPLVFPGWMRPLGLSPQSATDLFYRRFQFLYRGHAA